MATTATTTTTTTTIGTKDLGYSESVLLRKSDRNGKQVVFVLEKYTDPEIAKAQIAVYEDYNQGGIGILVREDAIHELTDENRPQLARESGFTVESLASATHYFGQGSSRMFLSMETAPLILPAFEAAQAECEAAAGPRLRADRARSAAWSARFEAAKVEAARTGKPALLSVEEDELVNGEDGFYLYSSRSFVDAIGKVTHDRRRRAVG